MGTLPIVTSGVNTALQASTTHRESQLGQTKLACMPFPLLSRLAARARFSLGIEELTRRLDAIEAVLPAAPHFQGSTYLGDYIAVVATRWSGMMLVDTRDYLISPALVLDGLWEPDVTDWLRRTLKPGQVFVDIGANIGYFTLMGSRLVGERGRVFAVEPHPRLAELLTRNVNLNNLQNVTTLNRAAWSETATLKFHQRLHYAANSSMGSVGPVGLEQLGDSEEVVEVQAMELDELLTGGSHIDVVKVDVEGAEYRAFTGMRRILDANPKISILFEWSPGQVQLVGDKPEAVIELLAGLGFRFSLIADGMPPIDRSRLLELPYGNVVASR